MCQRAFYFPENMKLPLYLYRKVWNNAKQTKIFVKSFAIWEKSVIFALVMGLSSSSLLWLNISCNWNSHHVVKTRWLDLVYIVGRCVQNYLYNPCTAYCASSTPKNNRVGVTTLIYFRRWTCIINQNNHNKNNFAHLLNKNNFAYLLNRLIFLKGLLQKKVMICTFFAYNRAEFVNFLLLLHIENCI